MFFTIPSITRPINGVAKALSRLASLNLTPDLSLHWIGKTKARENGNPGLNPNSAQGDRVIVDILKEMGATPKWQGTSLLATPAPTRGIIVDVAQCPDIVPILAVLAARSEGITKIINAERLRIKESDRLVAMRSELTKLGVMIEETKSTLTITGTRNLNSASVDSHDDHRIAMSMGLLAYCLTSL